MICKLIINFELMNDSLVVIPTYNERENAPEIIRKVFSLPVLFDVLIIDDNSPDGTGDIIKELQSEYPGRLHLEQRKGKLGLGTAYIHGFHYALRRGYQYIFEMDADFSITPKTWYACVPLVPTMATTWPLAAAILKG